MMPQQPLAAAVNQTTEIGLGIAPSVVDNPNGASRFDFRTTRAAFQF